MFCYDPGCGLTHRLRRRRQGQLPRKPAPDTVNLVPWLEVISTSWNDSAASTEKGCSLTSVEKLGLRAIG